MTQENVRLSLFKHLGRFVEDEQYATIWPNQETDPPNAAGTAWLQPNVLFAEPRIATLGSSGKNHIHGVMVVNVFYPKGELSGVPAQIAEGLVAHFARRTVTPEVEGISARVKVAWQDVPVDKEGDKWYQIPVKIRFEATQYTT